MYFFEPKHTYLLINGVRRNFEEIIPQRKKRSLAENHVTGTLPRYLVRSFNDVGDVQCAIFDPDRMKTPVFSNITKVPFTRKYI